MPRNTLVDGVPWGTYPRWMLDPIAEHRRNEAQASLVESIPPAPTMSPTAKFARDLLTETNEATRREALGLPNQPQADRLRHADELSEMPTEGRQAFPSTNPHDA